MSSHKAAAAKPAGRRKPVLRVADNAPAAARVEASVSAATSDDARRLAAEIRTALARGQLEVLSPEALQALMAAICRLYSAQAEAGASHELLGPRSGVTATDAMVVASGLLKAVNLAVFELGMWQSWTGR
jgi:hypothetical protein